MTERTPVPPAQSPATGNRFDAVLPVGVRVPAITPVPSSRPADVERDASPTANSSTTAATASSAPYSITIADAMDIKETIANGSYATPNSLNDYLNYTYKFRLFMAQDVDYMKSLNAGDSAGEITSSSVFAAIDNNPVRIIAESGVTAGFCIQDVKIEAIVGPNRDTTNTNATNFIISITEPLGSSLIENMKNAAVELGVLNMDKCPYFLELSFVGYDESGQAVGIEDETTQGQRLLTQDFDNGGRWIYQIKITDIETELSSSGSSYQLTALPYNEHAFDHHMGTLPAGLNVEGSTVQEFLDDFATKLNDSWQKYFFNNPNYPVYQFEFKVHDVEDANASQFRLAPENPDLEEIRSFGWLSLGTDGASPVAYCGLGMAVSEVIEMVLANTEEVKNRARSILVEAENALDGDAQTEAREQNQNLAGVALYRAARMFRAEPDIEILGYFHRDQIYRKKCVMHVWPYYTQAPVLSQSLARQAREKEYQLRLISELVNRGFFRKKYDYIFTGNNTEVLRLDIRFNLAWAAVVPFLNSSSNTAETTVHSRREDDQDSGNQDEADDTIRPVDDNLTGTARIDATRELASRKKEARDRLDIIDVQLAQARRDGNEEAIARLTTERAQAQSLVTQYDFAYANSVNTGDTLATIRRDAQNEITSEQDAANNRALPRARKLYLEDMDTADDSDSLPLQISFVRPITQGRNVTGAGMYAPHAGERGVYGAILEQMYGPLTTGLINIDLEIRGDPYWLSYSNIERRIHLRTEANLLVPQSPMANYTEGDNVFMLEFSYPYDINGETGDINIRETTNVNNNARFSVDRIDKFTGLYRVVRCTNIFSGGEFKQILKSQRYPLHDLARAMQFEGDLSGGTYGGAATRDAPAVTPAERTASQSRPTANTPERQNTGTAATPPNQSSTVAGLDPRMQRVFTRAQALAREDGLDVRIAGGGGRRTPEEQARIVGRGASGTLNSRHLSGQAVDVAVFVNGRYQDNGSHPGYARFSQYMDRAARELNTPVLWGGNFRDPNLAARERSHYELRR